MNQVWNEIFKLIMHPFAKAAKNERCSRASSPCAVDSIKRKRFFPDDVQKIMDALMHVDAAPNHLEKYILLVSLGIQRQKFLSWLSLSLSFSTSTFLSFYYRARGTKK